MADSALIEKDPLAKKERKEKQEHEEDKPRETTVEFLASLAAVLVTGLFIITFVLQAFEIPSSSMENTLLIGDHVFVNRIQFSPPTPGPGLSCPIGTYGTRTLLSFFRLRSPASTW